MWLGILNKKFIKILIAVFSDKTVKFKIIEQ